MPEISQADYDALHRIRNVYDDVPGLSWLRILIGDYERLYDIDADEDPSATAEMLGECRALADALDGIRREPAPAAPMNERDEEIPW